jgi:hypothetical protein
MALDLNAIQLIEEKMGPSCSRRVTELLATIKQNGIAFPDVLVYSEDAFLFRWHDRTLHVLYEAEPDLNALGPKGPANCFYLLQRFNPVADCRYYGDIDALVRELKS